MNGINSVKNYKYSFLVKKNKKFKNLKNGKKNVRWDPHLYILLVCKISTQNICRKV